MKDNHRQFLFYSGLIILLFTAFTLGHEQVHVSIAEDYGCSDTQINMVPNLREGWLMSAEYDCAHLTNQEALMHHSDQRTVEAVGYQLYIFLGLFIIWSVLTRD